MDRRSGETILYDRDPVPRNEGGGGHHVLAMTAAISMIDRSAKPIAFERYDAQCLEPIAGDIRLVWHQNDFDLFGEARVMPT